MQMNVVRAASKREVMADLCSSIEVLEENISEEEIDWDLFYEGEDPEWALQYADDEAWNRRQKCLWVKSHRPEVTDEEALDLNAQFEIFYRGGNSFDDALEWSGIRENPHPTVRFVRRFNPYCTEQECFISYETYFQYRDEGQSSIVSRQYAGLL